MKMWGVIKLRGVSLLLVLSLVPSAAPPPVLFLVPRQLDDGRIVGYESGRT